MTHDTPPRIRCRPNGDADIEGLVELLSKGFPNRTRGYWARAVQQLARLETPPRYPRFGYVLELDCAQIGVILLMFSTQNARKGHVRRNISSWYLDPRYRNYGSLLIAAAVRHKDVTYVDYGCPAYIFIEKRKCQSFRLSAAPSPWNCRYVGDFARFASPIGRALMRRGSLFVRLDAAGPLPGLVSKYIPDHGRKYFTDERASATSLFQKVYYLAFDASHRTNRLKQAK